MVLGSKEGGRGWGAKPWWRDWFLDGRGCFYSRRKEERIGACAGFGFLCEDFGVGVFLMEFVK